MLTSLIVDQNEDLKKLLTQLRGELNLLNTLNCNVHKYQGDFLIDRDEAAKRTTAANALYLAHLQSRVTPLFVELGQTLDGEGIAPLLGLTSAEEYAALARNWYRENYNTGEMW